MTPDAEKYLQLTQKLQEYTKIDPYTMGIDRLIDSLLDELDELWYKMSEEEIAWVEKEIERIIHK